MRTLLIVLLAGLAGCATRPGPNFQPAPPVTQTTRVPLNAEARQAEDSVPLKIYAPRRPLASKPAVIYIGRCDGEVDAADATIVHELVARGITVAQLASQRSVDPTAAACDDKAWRADGLRRAIEAFKARNELVRMGLAEIHNVGLLGTAGGSALTNAAYGRPTNVPDTAIPFRAAVALYPFCQPIETPGSELKTPTLILISATDDWTPISPCAQKQRQKPSPQQPQIKVLGRSPQPKPIGPAMLPNAFVINTQLDVAAPPSDRGTMIESVSLTVKFLTSELR